jgi:hypothetical protein
MARPTSRKPGLPWLVVPEPLPARTCLAADCTTGCTVGLGANERAHGYCMKHAARIRKHGDPYMLHGASTRPRKPGLLRRLTDLLRRN